MTEPVDLDEVTGWIEADRKYLSGESEYTHPDAGFRLELMCEKTEALIAELRKAREEADAERSLADFADAHVEGWQKRALDAEAKLAAFEAGIR